MQQGGTVLRAHVGADRDVASPNIYSRGRQNHQLTIPILGSRQAVSTNAWIYKTSQMEIVLYKISPESKASTSAQPVRRQNWRGSISSTPAQSWRRTTAAHRRPPPASTSPTALFDSRFAPPARRRRRRTRRPALGGRCSYGQSRWNTCQTQSAKPSAATTAPII